MRVSRDKGSMPMQRHLDWEGCFNVRDLGGLRTVDGGETRSGSLVRADGLNRLTRNGWATLEDHGIRTVVDLRNEEEIGPDVGPRPKGLTTVHVPMDDTADTEFWENVRSDDLDGSPLFFRPFLERKPERCAAAVTAVCRAEPGGVAFHCGRGRDRTGLLSVSILALVGVVAEEIATDYELSTERVRRLDAALGENDQGSEIAEILRRKRTTARALILDLLESIDVPAHLRAGGLADDDIAALRARLVVP
ncbi:MAG: tyrosine-protein phosphatase [Actinomycetota bacterium]